MLSYKPLKSKCNFNNCKQNKNSVKTNVNHTATVSTRHFKRPRMLIMGCGDIGKRIIKNSPTFMRFICINSKHNYSDNHLQTQSQSPSPSNTMQIYINLDEDNSVLKSQLLKLKPFITKTVYLIPPQNSTNIDNRIKSMAYLLLGHSHKLADIAYVSTTGVYGNHNGNFVDENTLTNPKTARAKRRVYAENFMRKLCNNPYRNKNLSILRVPGIYAQNRLPLAKLQTPTPVLNQDEDVYTNHIHADDLARIIYLGLMSKKSKGGRVINMVDDSDIKAGDWLEYVATKHNLIMPIRMNRETLIQNIDEARLSFLSESRRIKNVRLKKEWKIKLKYPNVFVGLED
jgi:hypothetical protein